MSTVPTFVLIHGGSSNAKSWGPLQQQLALRGCRSLAVDLPGHGPNAPFYASYHANPQDVEGFAAAASHMAKVTLADSVAHVVDVVRQVAQFGPVIIASSSMGGLIATGVANEVPDLLANNVYLSAAVPIDGQDLTDPADDAEILLDSAVVPLVMADPTELGAARLNWRRALHDHELRARLREAMMAEASDDQFAALISTFDTDELFVTASQAGDVLAADEAESRSEGAVATVAVDPSRWGSAPHAFVRLTADRCISLRQQNLMIAAADVLTPNNPFTVRTFDGSHVAYFVRPAEFAELLIGLVED